MFRFHSKQQLRNFQKLIRACKIIHFHFHFTLKRWNHDCDKATMMNRIIRASKKKKLALEGMEQYFICRGRVKRHFESEGKSF